MKISETHCFDIHIASKYSIEEAILIHHFAFWINHNKRLGRNFIDGKTWTHQTRKEIAAHYPYLSEDQVYRILRKLIKKGVLLEANHNSTRFDRTKWFAFNDEEILNVDESHTPCAESHNGSRGIAQPIPDTKPNTKRDTNVSPKTSAKKASPKKKREPTLKFPEDALEIAERFKESLLSWKPGVRSKPATWVPDIDKLLKGNKDREPVSKQRIMKLIPWLAEGGNDRSMFWRRFVLSGEKLLKHFDAMEADMMSRQRKSESDALEEVRRERRGY